VVQIHMQDLMKVARIIDHGKSIKKEIAWLMDVDQADNVFTVSNPRVFPQIVSAGHFECDDREDRHNLWMEEQLKLADGKPFGQCTCHLHPGDTGVPIPSQLDKTDWEEDDPGDKVRVYIIWTNVFQGCQYVQVRTPEFIFDNNECTFKVFGDGLEDMDFTDVREPEVKVTTTPRTTAAPPRGTGYAGQARLNYYGDNHGYYDDDAWDKWNRRAMTYSGR